MPDRPPAKPVIDAPHSRLLGELCERLAAQADAVDLSGQWPGEQLQLCSQAGVWGWFLPSEWGGRDWDDAAIALGYFRLAAACLTTTFIITQRTAACGRIVESDNDALKAKLLPGLLTGESFATVGISHLTTSHRHLARPVLSARETAGGFLLDGFSPWVTGAAHAQTIVTGATLDDGQQILVALPTDLPGVVVEPPVRLLALSASATGRVRLEHVEIDRKWLLAGPAPNVMAGSGGSRTGGLQTSSLAIGLARAAIEFIAAEAGERPDLAPVVAGLREDEVALSDDLLATARGEGLCSADDLRVRANSLALRASQATLAAAKGRGYVWGHRAGRYCREALFFLVWSCPQPVVHANLCELAGLSD